MGTPELLMVPFGVVVALWLLGTLLVATIDFARERGIGQTIKVGLAILVVGMFLWGAAMQ